MFIYKGILPKFLNLSNLSSKFFFSFFRLRLCQNFTSLGFPSAVDFPSVVLTRLLSWGGELPLSSGLDSNPASPSA